MAGIFGSAITAEIALTAATAKTVLQLKAPTNHRVKILGWGVFFDGISATAEPVVVRVLRQTTTGTMSALTPGQVIPVAETILTTAAHTATAEPTASTLVESIECHPQGGYEKTYNQGQEPVIAGGGYVGIECNAPAGVNVTAKFFFEE